MCFVKFKKNVSVSHLLTLIIKIASIIKMFIVFQMTGNARR